MKRFFILLFLLTLSIVSCNCNYGVDEGVLEDDKKITDILIEEHYLYSSETLNDEYFDNYSEENIYESGDLTDISGIISGQYNIFNGKYYFEVKQKYKYQNNMTGISMTASIDLINGQKSYLCKEPLCTHDTNSTCNMLGIIPSAYCNGYLVAYTSEVYGEKSTAENIYIIDPITGKKQIIQSYPYNWDDQAVPFVIHMGVCNTKFFYTLRQTTYNPKTKLSEMVASVYSYDLSTNKLSSPTPIPQKYCDSDAFVFYVDENYFYWMSSGLGLFITDHTFQTENFLFDYTPNPYIVNTWYVDTNTNEMYILFGDSKQFTGTIYRISGTNIEKLTMPHEHIYWFQLTNSKIYYSIYDPYLYGVYYNGDKVYEYGGGKIYVTDRQNRNSADVLFDNHQNKHFPLRNWWTVIGDYLYIDKWQLIESGEYTYFSSALFLRKMRINIDDQTIKYFRFD